MSNSFLLISANYSLELTTKKIKKQIFFLNLKMATCKIDILFRSHFHGRFLHFPKNYICGCILNQKILQFFKKTDNYSVTNKITLQYEKFNNSPLNLYALL